MYKEQLRLFLKFLKYVYPYRALQVMILALSGISVLLGLVNPYLGKLIVDRSIMGKDLKSFFFLGVIGAGVFIIDGVIKALENFFKKKIALKLRFAINRKVFSHLQGLSVDFFQDKSTGEHMFKISYDIERVVDFISGVPEELINILPKLFLTLIVVSYLDWQMAGFTLLLVPVLYLPVSFFTLRMRKALGEWLVNSQNIFKRLQEVFSHMYLVKAFGKEKKESVNYLRALTNNIRINYKSIRLEIISNFLGSSLERIMVGMITLFGGYQVIRGRISMGTFTAIMLYLSQLVNIQSRIAFAFQRISLGLVSCKRLEDLLKEKSSIADGPQARDILIKNPEIRLQGVVFRYGRQGYLLKGMDLSFGMGVNALVGHSASGKTTILNLILRLYQPEAGTIFIDGRNICDYRLRSLRAQIGIALQDPFLWNDTIENNLRYGDASVRMSDIIEAAVLTEADEFIQRLPAGYKSIIGENACKISEGQKQRLAIARAIVKRPKILILDEAMSSMDSESEERILARLKRSPGISSVILVSHRLSAVMHADRVYFLSSADKVISGEAGRLLRENKSFYDLFSAQAKNCPPDKTDFR